MMRGKTRNRWTGSGMCAGVYELLVQMKGGPTRARLLALLAEPKNKLQLANELGIDWKAVAKHKWLELPCFTAFGDEAVGVESGAIICPNLLMEASAATSK